MKPVPRKNVQCANVTVPVDAPIRNGPHERSPDALRAVLAQFDVEANPRYRVRDTSGDGVEDTFCNIFVWDATRALGCELDHYDENGRERSANGLALWLETCGPYQDWLQVDASTAGACAARGRPVVAVWRNPGKGPGHVAVLLPPHGAQLRIAQAGRSNLFDVPIVRGFGRLLAAVKFYAHD